MSQPQQPHTAEEVELKLILEDEHDLATLGEALAAAAGPPRTKEQTNLYLDTASRLLGRHSVMLRVRRSLEAGGATKLVATVKANAQLQDGVMRAAETEAPLDAAGVTIWGQGTRDGRLDTLGLPEAVVQAVRAIVGEAVDREALHVLGAALNTRRVFALPAAALDLPGEDATITFELDHTRYPADVERFELELERVDAATVAPAIRGWLEGLGVRHAPATRGKFAQFIEVVEGWVAPTRRWSPRGVS
jgi:uncharacterized protein YjbK